MSLEKLFGDAADVLDIFRRVAQLVRRLEEPSSVRFVSTKYLNPTTGEWFMAQSLLNDRVSNIPLEFDNLAGQKVNTPSTGNITLAVLDTTGAPSTAATIAMGSDGSSVDVTPTPMDGTNVAEFTISFDDVTNVDIKSNLDCQFTNDPAAASAHFVTTGITTTPPLP
jgi:hypothetical protein